MEHKLSKNRLINMYLKRIEGVTDYSMHLESIDVKLPRAILPISNNENDEYDDIKALFYQNGINPIAEIIIRYMNDEFKIKIALSEKECFSEIKIKKHSDIENFMSYHHIEDNISMKPSNFLIFLNKLLKKYQPWETSIICK